MTMAKLYPFIAAALVVVALALIGSRGDRRLSEERERSRRREAADSATYATVTAMLRDSIARARATADSLRGRARALTTERRGLLSRITKFDSFVPRPVVDTLLAQDSVLLATKDSIIHQDSLQLHMHRSMQAAAELRIAGLHRSLHEAWDDAAKWEKQARRGNGWNVVYGAGYTVPSGDPQIFIGLGRRVRLPFGL